MLFRKSLRNACFATDLESETRKLSNSESECSFSVGIIFLSQALHEDVRKKALMRLEYEGLSKCEAVSTEGARWYNDPAGFAMERYAYYVCFKCGKAYFGGEARCDLDAGAGDAFNPEELVCGGCSDVSQAQMCPKHGTDYLEYKVFKS